MVEDAGSSHGTLVDGRPVSGPTRAARRRDDLRRRRGPAAWSATATRSEAGRTIVVPANGSVVVDAAGHASVRQPGTQAGFRPAMRPGWRLKRLEADEGRLRWVLSSDHMPELLRMGEDEAAIVQMLDGETSLPELMAEAERRYGDAGVTRLAGLLATLGERGLLEGVDAPEAHARDGRLARLTRPRERAFAGAGAFFERLYRRGGWVLFTRTGLVVLDADRRRRARRVHRPDRGARRHARSWWRTGSASAGSCSCIGRLLVVAIHELAHGLAMASFGRRVPRAGIKAIIGIPFAFVDTTEAWFEPRRRRIAISAAGPASDLVVGGDRGARGAGARRREPARHRLPGRVGGLRRARSTTSTRCSTATATTCSSTTSASRACESAPASAWPAASRGSGPRRGDTSRAIAIYGVASLVWMVLAAGFVIILTSRLLRPADGHRAAGGGVGGARRVLSPALRPRGVRPRPPAHRAAARRRRRGGRCRWIASSPPTCWRGS